MDDDDALVSALEHEDGDIDRIDPESEFLTLECGIEVKILPLRTRQLFKLLRIITHGAGMRLMQSGINFKDDPEEFLAKLISLVLFSLPDADQEAVDFIQAIAEPADLLGTDKAPRDMTEAERAHNVAAWTELNLELWNPNPLDTITIVEHVLMRESKDLQALGKRIRQFLVLAQKTGQLKTGKQAPQDLNLPDNSAGSSTSSAPRTGGQTNTSSTSRSAASGKSSQRSKSAAGRRSAPVAP